jgi:hypothetical protein
LKILFFAPHSGVWIHSFPEALVAEALQQHGHEIIYVGCRGLLKSHCVCMSAALVPFGSSPAMKDRVCRSCKSNDEILRTEFDLAGPNLIDLATVDDLKFADDLLRSTERVKFPDLELDGVEVGRIALYELLIQSKRGALELSAAETLRYKESLKNVLVVVRSMQRMLDAVKPDRIVLYNALYSVNRAVCRLAEIRAIPQYYLHAGDNLSRRLQTLVLARNHTFFYYEHLLDKWGEFERRPCPPDAMTAATNHLLEVARGRSIWAYSTAPKGVVDLRRQWRIGARKVICATMSSPDETFGGEVAGVLSPVGGLLFPTQVDWIRNLIAYVKARPDLFLVIRVHPREFPNKRERLVSDHAKMLMEAFATLPGNVRVNWPADRVSLYDVAVITDVFVNAWSSAGREMAWLGLPVVLYSPHLTHYPPDLNYVGSTEPEYFRQIEQALKDGWSAERIRKTYRSCAVDLYFAALDISDSFSVDEHVSSARRALNRLMRKLAPTRLQRSNCRQRAAHLASADRINRILSDELTAAFDLDDIQAPVTYAEETLSLKREVRRIVDALYGRRGNFAKDSLPGKLLDFATS